MSALLEQVSDAGVIAAAILISLGVIELFLSFTKGPSS